MLELLLLQLLLLYEPLALQLSLVVGFPVSENFGGKRALATAALRTHLIEHILHVFGFLLQTTDPTKKTSCQQQP